MDLRRALAFVRRHGVVLESAHGPVVTFADAVAGERIIGSWWGHRKGHEIFWLTRELRHSKEILVCRLIEGKITYVHRRLWPPLVRLRLELPRSRLAAIREIHTDAGQHVVRVRAFPSWVPPAVAREAKQLSAEAARAALGSVVWARAIVKVTTRSPRTPDHPTR